MSSPADNVTELHPVAEPTADELRWMYRVGSRSRVLEEHVVRLVARGEVKFAIWGPGEEVFGVAMALALSKTCDPTKFGVVPHYRSASFVSGWCELHGVELFVDGTSVGAGRAERTTPFLFGLNSKFAIGWNPGLPVSEDYGPGEANRFPGTVEWVRIEVEEPPTEESVHDRARTALGTH